MRFLQYLAYILLDFEWQQILSVLQDSNEFWGHQLQLLSLSHAYSSVFAVLLQGTNIFFYHSYTTPQLRQDMAEGQLF